MGGVALLVAGLSFCGESGERENVPPRQSPIVVTNAQTPDAETDVEIFPDSGVVDSEVSIKDGEVDAISEEMWRRALINIRSLDGDSLADLFDGELDREFLLNFNKCLAVAEHDYEEHDKVVMAKNKEEYGSLRECEQAAFEKCTEKCEIDENGKFGEECLAIISNCDVSDTDCDQLRPSKVTEHVASRFDFFEGCLSSENVERANSDNAMDTLKALLAKDVMRSAEISCGRLIEREEWMKKILVELVKILGSGEDLNDSGFNVRTSIVAMGVAVEVQIDELISLMHTCDQTDLEKYNKFILSARDLLKRLEQLTYGI